MLTTDASLATILANTQTKQAWSAALIAALGATRRVKCVRHSNAATPQANVFSTGVLFRNAALTGTMRASGGIVTYYGATSDLTTCMPADLSTGISVLRIEGGGHYIEGTLGLTGTDADFTFPTNPTATNSIAVSPNLRITPPLFMSSGTGYAPPSLGSDAPAYVIIENWTNPAAVTEAGRIYFDKRIANWVFEDPEYASNMGDIRVTQSTTSVTYGAFEFGAMLISTDPQVGTINGQVLHQTAINFKPTEANWPSYPRQTGATGGGYRRGSRVINGVSRAYGMSDTFMPPFKAKICRADGVVLHTHQMRDGLPINSPELSEVATKTKAIRPKLHCASMLVWESHKPKLNTYASKYFPGVDSENLRPSLMKERAALNGCYPMYYTGQGDSTNHWYGVAKWALPCDISYLAADEATRTDPYLWSLGPNFNAAANPWSTPPFATFYGVPAGEFGNSNGAALHQGWGYEPGSWSVHDQFSGPGGKRIDRSIIPSPIAIHMTNPNWVHLRDNTPITEMVENWNMAYFNHAVHNFLDVKTFAMVPNSEVLAGEWCHGNTYYNGAALTFTTLNKTIPLFALSASQGADDTQPHYGAFTDSNYRMPWNGYSNDYFHNYCCPGWAALLYNSPMHALSNKLRYFGSIMSQGLSTAPSAAHGGFLVRNHAWLLFQDCMMWKLASDHPLGISRAEIETRIAGELQALHDNIYIPLVVQNSQSMQFRAIRNLGIAVVYDATIGWFPRSFTLQYYMAHTLQLWRQTGLWKVMYDRSDVCRNALLTIVNALDKGCIDYYLDTDGCYSGDVYNAGVDLWIGDRMNPAESTEIAASWADWLARKNPKASPQEDLIHNAAGAFRHPDVGEHSRMQWPFIRRDYFPDIPALRDVNACCAKVKGWQDAWRDRIVAMETGGTSKRGIALTDWAVHPALGRILPPTVLEP